MIEKYLDKKIYGRLEVIEELAQSLNDISGEIKASLQIIHILRCIKEEINNNK